MKQYVELEELVDFLKICFKFKWGDENEDEIMDVSSRYYGWQAMGNLVNRSGEVYIDADDYEWSVTHWMPLPLKPEV